MNNTLSPSVSAWHTLTPNAIADRLDSDITNGLSDTDANDRLHEQGLNRLSEKPPRSPWLLLLDQFKGFLILVLIGAAVLAGAIGDIKDAVVILIVVVINALLGFYQEYRAEQSLAALKKMLAPEAEVRRNGKARMIPAEQLVPGDIVLLDSGDRVPTDGRVITAHNFEVDESSLTGESHTVGKHADVLANEDIPLAERYNMLYMNTTVTRGRAEMLVTTTGMETEMGRLAGMLAEAEEAPTPLQIQLDGLGKRLAAIAGVVVVIMLIGGLMRGEPWVDMIMTAIALAVAAIPEGLPAVVTITLALGMHRMAKHKAIVKRLAAVETLGCTSVICSDKTGTLTVNKMTARALHTRDQKFAVEGEGYEAGGHIDIGDSTVLSDLNPALLSFALCNDAHLRGGQVVGDPMEGALLVLAVKGGLDPESLREKIPRIAEIPFDATHKYMASFHLKDGQVLVFVKGAPDILIEQCTSWLGCEGERLLDSNTKAALLAENEALARDGLRVIAAASRTFSARDFDPATDLFHYMNNLRLDGLVGLMDPPRPEARDAIGLCHRAGIAAKMITGDQKVTAAAIATELGINGEVLSSAELDALDDVQLVKRIDDISVFARATPEQKVRIVHALKARDHIVAMTGDGVNDAPALKNADIGIAMGMTGTDVTKEAATIVLTDDNFATIVHAVGEGRTIYDNIVKFVRFQLSTNIGAILTVLAAPFLGLPLPFSPIQLLWVNIIMDGPPAMALGVDPARPGVMDVPPRAADERILTLRRLSNLAAYGVTMAVGTLGVLLWSLQNRTEQQALTLAFTTFVLFQVFNTFNARADTGSAFNSTFFQNRALWLSLAGVVGLQFLVVYWPPAQNVFNTTALSTADWGIAALVASSVLMLEEARKKLMKMGLKESIKIKGVE
ncbi:MAG: calcium-translocating P-type ATPase, PMCA-type [Campylobacterota bacterium]|nr:calcium-translocating P-type ATPase, PMCA-type [Campylobacterota bacterium]